MSSTDMFFDIAKNINEASQTSSRYGKITVLRDLLSEINSLKDNDTATILKIKILIEGKINGIKKDIKNNQKFDDPFLDSM
jgi:Rad3-related DNA helicase